MNTLLIVPCFNDNYHLKKLLNCKTFKGFNGKIEILVIDDGSNESLSNEGIGINFKLIRNNINKGKGYSLRKGFAYALENNYTHAITMDADLQHDPKYINKFISIDKNIDIVIGSRKFDSAMPLSRRFSNKVTSFILSVLSSKKIYDSQSGYRRYKLDSSPFKHCIEDGFQFESEILIDTLKQKQAALSHIQIPTLYNNEKSSINNVVDTYKFIKLIIRKILGR